MLQTAQFFLCDAEGDSRRSDGEVGNEERKERVKDEEEKHGYTENDGVLWDEDPVLQCETQFTAVNHTVYGYCIV